MLVLIIFVIIYWYLISFGIIKYIDIKENINNSQIQKISRNPNFLKPRIRNRTRLKKKTSEQQQGGDGDGDEEQFRLQEEEYA